MKETPKSPGFFSRVKNTIGLGPDEAVEPTPDRTPARPNGVNETPPKQSNGFLTRVRNALDRDTGAGEITEKPDRPADWKERWVITDESTGFFEFGPSQANGPDRRLNRGSVVKIASQSSRGWAKVELEDGRQGYIGTDQMRQATEADFAGPLSTRPSGTPSSSLASANAKPAVDGWSPMAPLPDLPALPSVGGSDSQLLLPPLEFEGTELKRSSLRLPPSGPPTLSPGDALPTSSEELLPMPALEEKMNLPDLEPIKTELQPAPTLDDPATEPDAPAAAESPPDPVVPAEAPAETSPDPAPAPPDPDTPVPVLPPPSEPTIPR